jgi:hypothetical protein
MGRQKQQKRKGGGEGKLNTNYRRNLDLIT